MEEHTMYKIALFLAFILLSAPASMALGVNQETTQNGSDGKSELESSLKSEIIVADSKEISPGDALMVNVDLRTHEMTLHTLPADQTTIPMEANENDPNCLSTQRRSWVQQGEPFNLNAPGPTAGLGIDGAVGNCQGWKANTGGIAQLTFVLVERVGGSVDAVDEPTQSYISVECDRSGFAYGAPETGKRVQSITCEYRSGGDLPTNWTFWDSLMQLRGQTVAGTGYGFGYAAFE